MQSSLYYKNLFYPKNPRFIIKSGFKSKAGYNGACTYRTYCSLPSKLLMLTGLTYWTTQWWYQSQVLQICLFYFLALLPLATSFVPSIVWDSYIFIDFHPYRTLVVPTYQQACKPCLNFVWCPRSIGGISLFVWSLQMWKLFAVASRRISPNKALVFKTITILDICP